MAVYSKDNPHYNPKNPEYDPSHPNRSSNEEGETYVPGAEEKDAEKAPEKE